MGNLLTQATTKHARPKGRERCTHRAGQNSELSELVRSCTSGALNRGATAWALLLLGRDPAEREGGSPLSLGKGAGAACSPFSASRDAEHPLWVRLLSTALPEMGRERAVAPLSSFQPMAEHNASKKGKILLQVALVTKEEHQLGKTKANQPENRTQAVAHSQATKTALPDSSEDPIICVTYDENGSHTRKCSV